MAESIWAIRGFDSITVHIADYKGLTEIEGSKVIARPLMSSIFQLGLKHGCHVGRAAFQSYPGYVKLPGDNTLGINA